MKPIKFKEQTKTFAENQKPYLPLPAWQDDNDEKGMVISCWRLTVWERIQALWLGVIWVNEMTFGDPPQPISLSVKTPFEKPEK